MLILKSLMYEEWQIDSIVRLMTCRGNVVVEAFVRHVVREIENERIGCSPRLAPGSFDTDLPILTGVLLPCA